MTDFSERSVGLLTASGGGSAEQAARSNVVLLMTDDQGYGDLSCHGNPVLQTPNLDKLHGEAVWVFVEAPGAYAAIRPARGGHDWAEEAEKPADGSQWRGRDHKRRAQTGPRFSRKAFMFARPPGRKQESSHTDSWSLRRRQQLFAR